MRDVASPEFSRNYGFWSQAEQQALLHSDVSVAGVGGDGYLLGLSLVRMGVGRLRIADPEVFELENINRVPGATRARVDKPKVECFAEDAKAINPDLELRVYPEGVTLKNCEEFLDGSNLVVDESELTRLEVGTLIADAARQAGIPNLQVMNIGFAAQVMSFHPASNETFRTMMGIPATANLTEVARRSLDIKRVLPFLPPYLDIETLNAVAAAAPLPSIVQGVNLAAALGTSQAFLHLTNGVDANRDGPIWYPNILYVDSLTGETKTTKHFSRSHKISLGRLRWNNWRNRVTRLTYPLTSFESARNDAGSSVPHAVQHPLSVETLDF